MQLVLSMRYYNWCRPIINKRCFSISRSISVENITSRKRENFNESEVIIKTCGSLYEKWRKQKKFRKLPEGNLDFKVKYIDTYKGQINSSNISQNVVLALHGAPGSYSDFTNLASYLQSRGSRVIIPSFPDFSVYPPGVFRHSAEEKVQFIKDFLSAISVNHIDVLVVHSSAVYPGMLLCLDEMPSVKSIVMLNPGTFSYKMKATRNINMLKMLAKFSEYPSVLAILQYIGPLILKIIIAPVRIENFLDPLLSAVCTVYAGVPEAKQRFLDLIKHEIPIFYAFSNNDKLVGKEVSYDLAYLLGACDSDIYVYDKDGNLIQNGKETPILKVMSFEKGSHYVFWKHADIINEAIGDFITKLHQQNKQ